MCETALCDTITQDNVLGPFLTSLHFKPAFHRVTYEVQFLNWNPFMMFSLHVDLLVLADLHGASVVRGLALKVARN